MSPKSLGSLDNHKQEAWKAPLPEFIEHLYEKRFGRRQPEKVFSIEQLAEQQLAKKARKRARKAERLGVVREQNAHLGEVRGGRARRSMQAMPSIVEADRRCHHVSGDAQMGRLFPDHALAQAGPPEEDSGEPQP